MMISPHFALAEFAYHGQEPPQNFAHPDLLEGLERLRNTAGQRPLYITPGGGWRPLRQDTSDYQAHSRGLGADVYAKHIELHELHELATFVRVFRVSGIGLYPESRFIHVDVGRPRPLRWVRIAGNYYYY